MDIPSWALNPCGYAEAPAPINESNSCEPALDTDLEVVFTPITRALSKANDIKNNLTQEIFGDNAFDEWATQLTPMGSTKYDWLDRLPDEYVNQSAKIPKDKENIKIEDALQEAYMKIQLIGVALERSVENQKKHGEKLHNEFELTFAYVKMLLCELRTLLRDCNIVPIRRSIIPKDLDNLDKTESKIYNFFVLKETIKTLNYYNKIFEHLNNNKKN